MLDSTTKVLGVALIRFECLYKDCSILNENIKLALFTNFELLPKSINNYYDVCSLKSKTIESAIEFIYFLMHFESKKIIPILSPYF